jgi:hypothetical protein
MASLMVEMFESSQAFTFFANENLITCKYKSKTLKTKKHMSTSANVEPY